MFILEFSMKRHNVPRDPEVGPFATMAAVIAFLAIGVVVFAGMLIIDRNSRTVNLAISFAAAGIVIASGFLLFHMKIKP